MPPRLLLLTVCLSLSNVLSANGRTVSDRGSFQSVSHSAKGVSAAHKAQWDYPPAYRNTSSVEVLYGREVADPYRWLENPDSEETKEFITAQNKLTASYTGQYKYRKEAKAALTNMHNYKRQSSPARHGEYYYITRNSGLQAQSVIYRDRSLSFEKQDVFFDPNQLSREGTAALATSSFSTTGRLFGYGTSYNGSDWMTLRVRCAVNFLQCRSGEDLADEVRWVKFSRMSWTSDERGFFYTRYPEPSTEQGGPGTDTGGNTNAMLYYHRIGTPQSEDQLILQDPEHPNYLFASDVTSDGRWLVVTVSRGGAINKLWVAPMNQDGSVPERVEFRSIVDDFSAAHGVIDSDDSLLYIMTNAGAPRYKIVTYDMNSPEAGFVDLVPQHATNVLKDAGIFADNRLYLHYLQDVKSILNIHVLPTGQKLRQLPTPVGSMSGFRYKRRNHELFFQMSSYLAPAITYRYDVSQDTVSEFHTTVVSGFNSNEFETKQVLVRSNDGTQIPMFITARKDIKLDGSNPALLYGYGGFSISLLPNFSSSWAFFLRHYNGVLAVANIRGGGEYGELWHGGGMLTQKQNSFDDFQSAAKYLSSQGYTRPARLTINGGSNGGLLVGASINQAPELFGCALADVGVMDMLRFHKFTIGHVWTAEYGNPDNEEDFEYLLDYSPLHNVRADRAYPAVLLTTNDHDDRVVPLHSYKLAAQLQYARRDNASPLMLRVGVNAGHGAGKPTEKLIEEWVNKFAFMALSLNLSWAL
ncbi:prolyl endopeptidase-like protein [Thamnocephalis sphaerospora]|uniref:Prolyl endopeptidase n=1 Tax=Thamnocephalis sphaerospora TaxID=78915 RepID=A0A4P9XJL6_9FUNG|nr:prolyl endopeptidase-like protein [Thamnocephalis sphaerospora]|eukprot:RKP05955.1 prolyl endopeptidase-like protein [Thamnocephalis sphaerospora]